MSAVVKTRQFKKLPVSTPALWVVLGLAVTFFLVRYGQEVLLEHELNSQVATQTRANSALTDENARLEARLNYYQSEKYVEQRAREDLNLRRADEEVLIPIGEQASDNASGTTITTAGEAPAAPTAVPQQGNWQKWLELFSPSSGP
jgi:cell division protein FtsB